MEVERREVADLTQQVRELIKLQAAQSARTEAFWTNGKGSQWDRDIRANTKAIQELNSRLSNIQEEGRVNKAKVLGILTATAAAGGGLSEAVHRFLGGS